MRLYRPLQAIKRLKRVKAEAATPSFMECGSCCNRNHRIRAMGKEAVPLTWLINLIQKISNAESTCASATMMSRIRMFLSPATEPFRKLRKFSASTARVVDAYLEFRGCRQWAEKKEKGLVDSPCLRKIMRNHEERTRRVTAHIPFAFLRPQASRSTGLWSFEPLRVFFLCLAQK